MVLLAAHRSDPRRHRLSRGAVRAALPLLLPLGGAILFDAAPAAAAPSATDTVYVANGPTTLSEPLPPGTPEVVTPLATAASDLCTPVSNAGGVVVGAVGVCDTYWFGPIAGTMVVAAVQPSTGVLLPEGYTCSPPTSGIDVVAGSAAVYLAPAGTGCS